MFLRFVGDDHRAFGPLGERIGDELGNPVFATIGEDSGGARGSLQRAGFVIDMVSEGFRVRFDDALRWLRRAWVPSGFAIVSADRVDEDGLFDLDNALRNLVPGTEGWRGNRDWFHEELAERPPFDPAAYLVAIDLSSGAHAGLVRIWRNLSGARLGLIGVLPRFRSAPIAAALLQRALAAASTWGHDGFVTETSLDNAVVHPRLNRLGESTGRFVQMVRDPSPRPTSEHLAT
jgi:GNAT superfamily N-acetyltransferase